LSIRERITGQAMNEVVIDFMGHAILGQGEHGFQLPEG
jgi:hypothetical protein